MLSGTFPGNERSMRHATRGASWGLVLFLFFGYLYPIDWRRGPLQVLGINIKLYILYKEAPSPEWGRSDSFTIKLKESQSARGLFALASDCIQVIYITVSSTVWSRQCMPVVPDSQLLRRLREEHGLIRKFRASLNTILRVCLQTPPDLASCCGAHLQH